MTNHRRPLIGLSVLAALTALGPLPGCNTWREPGAGGTPVSLDGVCTRFADCTAYEVCVRDGTVWCESRTCLASGRVDLDCVDSINRSSYGTPPPATSPDAGSTPPPPPPAGICGRVAAPPEQVAQAPDRSYCIHHFTRGANVYGFGWANVTADTAGSGVEVLSATLYGVRYDGTVAAVAGSGTSIAPQLWYERDRRSPWFIGPSTYLGTRTSLPTRFENVSTNPDMLHFGLMGTDVTAYREVFFVLEVRTWGDAQVQVGVDYDTNTTVEPGEVRPDGGKSDWFRCDTGATVRLASRRSDMDCDATLASIWSSPPPPPPPPTDSREFEVRLGSGFPDPCPSGWVMTVWGATVPDNLVSAPGGTIRSAAPYSWSAVSSLTMECASPHHWMDWSRWSGLTVADIPGFGTMTMCGVDIRSLVRIRHDVGSDPVRPVIVWTDARSVCP